MKIGYMHKKNTILPITYHGVMEFWKCRIPAIMGLSCYISIKLYTFEEKDHLKPISDTVFQKTKQKIGALGNASVKELTLEFDATFATWVSRQSIF